MPGCRPRRDLVILCFLVRGRGDDDGRFRGIGRAGARIRGVGAIRRDGRQCWRVLQQRCLNVHDGQLSVKIREARFRGEFRDNKIENTISLFPLVDYFGMLSRNIIKRRKLLENYL